MYISHTVTSCATPGASGSGPFLLRARPAVLPVPPHPPFLLIPSSATGAARSNRRRERRARSSSRSSGVDGYSGSTNGLGATSDAPLTRVTVAGARVSVEAADESRLG